VCHSQHDESAPRFRFKKMEFHDCIVMSSPSNYEEMCRRLRQKEGIDTFPKRGE